MNPAISCLALALLAIGPTEPDAAAIVRKLADRSSAWLVPQDSLASLEYEMILGSSSTTPIRAHRDRP